LKIKVQFYETRLPVSQRIMRLTLNFFPLLSVPLPPASAAANRYNARWPCRQNISPRMSEDGGTRSVPANSPVLIKSNTTSLTSGQEQSDGYNIFFTPCEGTTILPFKTEKFTHSTGNSVAWINASSHTSTTSTISTMHYGNSPVSARQNAAEVFSHSDLFYKLSDLNGVADTGTAVRKEIA